MKHTRLLELYNKTSKHSQYQVLASPLRAILPVKDLVVFSRYEKERLDYILKHVSPKGISFADIGGNTGYFSFELLDQGALSAVLMEGNTSHGEFVQEAASALGWQSKLSVRPEYITFGQDISSLNVDVTLLLNVLHHVGDDYGTKFQTADTARNNILESLASLSNRTKYLVFQLGYNWKGDRNLPLFARGTKVELIDFIKNGTKDNWSVEHVGIAESISGEIVYNEASDKNMPRNDSLGEFLNRPIFIMKSRHLFG